MVILVFLFCLLLPLPFSSGSTRPGCPTHCGNVAIPFPFGHAGLNCSIDPSFDILCNTSTTPPKPYLRALPDNLEIQEINGSQVWVKYPTLASTCYDLRDYQKGVNTTERLNIEIELAGTPYTISEDNWLIVVGCDDYATIRGDAFGGGCESYCMDGKGQSGTCTGEGNVFLAGKGCCRTFIPKGTTFLAAYMTDSHDTWRENKLFPCSYAFVGEKGENRFSYRLDGLWDKTTFLNQNPQVTKTPVVLDWRIGTQNCTQASRNSTFACKNNAVCVDFGTGVGGYLCRCADGYSGNPYLAGAAGCQADIDGRKDGSGCMRIPKSKIINFTTGLVSGMGFLLLLASCIWSFQRRKSKNLREKFNLSPAKELESTVFPKSLSSE